MLHSGKVLVTGGYGPNGSLASAEVYDPATGIWSSTGSMAMAREAPTATLLASGQVLVTGGEDSEGPLASAELYDPATGTWNSTGSMATVRVAHTATLLASGKVLVTGGEDLDGSLAGAEVYDPATGTWRTAGVMAMARKAHTAVVLASGKVLVTGGYGPGGLLSSAEVYDPATGGWTTAGVMATARETHTAEVLASGKVLVAGGYGQAGPLSRAEVYDPATGTWSTTGVMGTARYRHTATLLPSGKVLVMAGYGLSGYLSSAEVYDPAMGTWSTKGSLIAGRQYHEATLLASGKVLVTGGFGPSGNIASTEVYDPAMGAWSPMGSMSTARSTHRATLLASGKVLVTGGFSVAGSLATSELYDPATGTWSTTGSMTMARDAHTATLLASGKVLVTGGYGPSGYLATAELYDPDTGTWSTTGRMMTARDTHTATLLSSGKVLVIGGDSSRGVLTSMELYDPASGTWSSAGEMAKARMAHTATLLASGRVLVIGGHGTSGYLAHAELYDPDTGNRSTTNSLSLARADHTATLLASGKVLVIGGEGSSAYFDRMELYDPTTGNWSTTNPLSAARVYHTATLLDSGKVLVTGGFGSGGALSSMEVIDPTSPTVLTPINGSTLNNNRPFYSGTAELGSTVTVVVDGTARGTAGVNGSGEWNFTQPTVLTDGIHTVKAYATDSAGTISFESTPYAFTVDTQPPGAPQVLEPANGSTIKDNRPIYQGTVEAGSTVRVMVDGVAVGNRVANASGEWSCTQPAALADGVHTVKVQATDAGGNTSAESIAYTFIVDTVPPSSPVVLTPNNGSTINDNRPTYRGLAEARSTVTLWLGTTVLGTAGVNGSGIWNFTQPTVLSEGEHTVKAYATDSAGNTSAASMPYTFTVDTQPPGAPQVLEPANGSTIKDNRPIYQGTVEAGGTVKVMVDGVAVGTRVANASGEWNCTQPAVLADGVHTVKVQATDAGGNTSAESIAYTFIVDTVPPSSPVVLTPNNGSTINDNRPTYRGLAEARSTVTLWLGSTVLGTASTDEDGAWSFIPSTALSDGHLQTELTATDEVGNVSLSKTHLVTVDTVRPDAPEVSSPGELINTLKPTIAGTAEANSTVAVRMDGQEVWTIQADATGFWSVTLETPLIEGLHVAEVTATDKANNVSSTRVRTFTIDSLAPEAPEVTAPGALVNTRIPLIEGRAEVGSMVTVRLDETDAGIAMTDATGSWRFTPGAELFDGPHLVTAMATDAVGNISALSTAHPFTVDTQKPDAPEVGLPSSIVNTPKPTLGGTAEAKSTVNVWLDGLWVGTVPADEAGNWSVNVDTALAGGRHLVVATATDEASNTSQPSAEYAFIIPMSHYGWSCATAPVLPLSWALMALAWALRGRRQG
ncbi:High-affinity leucine-specific transport system, periplasmic binding protein LivK [Hyalangium minutum]|uniref:High-affinity leucine-specific transport system, periplasmic binding protein LivK n=1 Tax=Hyalangium minutum TaxID=394096 RepID=A0A085WSA3_9BACT|nr:High-affinity leucine-specific transport system, periplasmic binding protein LivK [Hyalangium minutum]